MSSKPPEGNLFSKNCLKKISTHPVICSHPNCYQTKNSFQGQFFVMQLQHDPEQLKDILVDCMSIDFHGRPAPLARFMEGGDRVKDGYDDEVSP